MRLHGLVSLSAVALLLGACSGSDSPSAPPPVTPQPDLVVLTMDAPDRVVPSRDVEVNFTYTNRGNAIAPAQGIHRVLLSLDSIESSGDLVLGTVQAQAIGPGATISASITHSRLSAAEGNRFIIVALDATRLVIESDEANNYRREPALVRGGPDLYFTEHYIGFFPYYLGSVKGDSATAIKLGNKGTQFPAKYRYSSVITTSSVYPTGASFQNPGNCCLPVAWPERQRLNGISGLKPGTYWSLIKVMAEDTVKYLDLDMSNNYSRVQFTIR
jgi:hypothetical protein